MNRACAGVALLLVAASLIPGVATGSRQPGNGRGPVEPMAGLRVGQWVRVEGIVSRDLAARCDELRLLTGDFLDEDWVIRGTVKTVDVPRGEFHVAGVPIRVDENTIFDTRSRTLKSLTDMRSGMVVDVEGTYVRDAAFLATEVDDESQRAARRREPGGRVLVVGKIERVDSRKRLVEVLGIAFQITETTRLKSVIR